MTSLPGGPLLYDRVVRLQLTPPDSQTTLVYGNMLPTDAYLRVNFGIERTLDGKADKCKVAVFNLNPSNRDALKANTRVILEAGYRAKNGLLFQGLVDKVKSVQQGPDIVTEMECADAGINLRFAPVKLVYSEQVSLARVLQDIAQSLSLTLDGNILSVSPGVIRGLPDKVYSRGITIEGTASAWLDKLLKPLKILWAVQNGRLLIIPQGQPTSVQPCVVLSSQTGMLDTPSFNEKGLVVNALMNSDILPGRLLQVDSKNKKVSGFYKAMACKYEGDTHDQNWHVEIEAQAVEGKVVLTPLASPIDFAKAVT